MVKQRAKADASGGAQSLAAGLYVTATPIGHARDITLRALDVLTLADLVLCEDTRVTKKLFALHALAHKSVNKQTGKPKNKLCAYHEHNAARVRPQILTRLAEGAAIALVSDAGTPLISDPGYRLVKQAQAAGHAVFTIPGASAPIAALSIAGLPSDRFFFVGFLSPQKTKRQAVLKDLTDMPATLILFETAPRLLALLQDMAALFGGRELVVCRELTKKFESLQRGRADDLLAAYRAKPPKGEIIVLVAPPHKTNRKGGARTPMTATDVSALLDEALMSQHMGEAATQIAQVANWSRRDVYQLALRRQKSHRKTTKHK